MKYYSLLLLSLAFMISSCNKYPSDSTSLEEQDVVITQYDRAVDFAAYKTYAITDSVFYLKNESGRVVTDTGYSQYSDKILGQINQNMAAYGFVRVAKNQNPHIGIDVTLINDENIGSYTSWYGSSWYWGYPYYGYGYGWPSTTYYKYESGTMNVNFLDITRVDTLNKSIPVIWSSQLVGLVSSTASYNATRIDNAIAIMFEQSPYLKK